MKSTLVEYLTAIGVQKIYFCSGARNAPLLKEFENKFEIEFKLDERAAAFEALGYAKITGSPAVVCTTSGTAVAECLPSVIEAYYSEVPLVILSADRPKRLRGTHAPQTIEQREIFKPFLNGYFSGTLADFNLRKSSYPQHINIEIDDVSEERLEFQREVSEIGSSEMKLIDKPLVVISEGHGLSQSQIDRLKKQKSYLYAEALANVDLTGCDRVIQFEKTLNSLVSKSQVKIIVHFGRTPLLKLWRELERKNIEIKVINFNRSKFGLSHGYTWSGEFDELLKFLEISAPSEPHREATIADYYKDLKNSEISIVSKIVNSLEDGTIVYAGNSMPIRYVELLKNSRLKYLANRGANGIDGQLSTLIGVAKASRCEVVGILGDLTFLYDFTSLLDELPKNLRIHVLDNNGGRIFERVIVDKRIINPHGKNLKELIKVLPSMKNITIHETDNDQTNTFWERWSL